MNKKLRFSLWFVLVIFIAIQFVPLNKENPNSEMAMDILEVTKAPEEVQNVIRNSCYDCHSNETKWPWYAQVAPVSFIIINHVEEGRDHVNFSEWASYNDEDHINILKEMKKEVEKNGMPLKSYVILHHNATINAEKKDLILSWIADLQAEY